MYKILNIFASENKEQENYFQRGFFSFQLEALSCDFVFSFENVSVHKELKFLNQNALHMHFKPDWDFENSEKTQKELSDLCKNEKRGCVR